MDDELGRRIEAMFAELQADGYDGKHEKVLSIIRETREKVLSIIRETREKVLSIIRETRRALTPAAGQLGLWEAEELAYAEAAVHVNFLLLALNATEKAIAVSQLPRDEYEYGFNYGKRGRR